MNIEKAIPNTLPELFFGTITRKPDNRLLNI